MFRTCVCCRLQMLEEMVEESDVSFEFEGVE